MVNRMGKRPVTQPDRIGRKVPCPKCGAPIGRPCRTTSDMPSTDSHVARLDAEADAE